MITPVKVYPGEKNHQFTITFTAPGPMDGDELVVTVPGDLQPATTNAEGTATTVTFDSTAIRVLGRGGAEYWS